MMSAPQDGSPGKSDFAKELWRGLTPFLGLAQTVLSLAYLLAGGGGRYWPFILALFGLQVAVNILISLRSMAVRDITLLMYVFAVFNWVVSSLTVGLAGGYPTLFWLMFVLGAIHAGLFIGRPGILMNGFVASAALSIPLLYFDAMDFPAAVGIGVEMLFLLVIGFITERITTTLLAEREKIKRAEVELRESRDELAAALEKQRQQTRDMTLLSEMGDFLQACQVLEDSYAIIGYYTPRLLPFPHGALYLSGESRDTLDAVSAWGGIEAGRNSPHCSRAHCWALRREQVLWMDESSTGMRCHHLDHSEVAQYMCIPLFAQREVIGILHLQSRIAESPAPIPDGEARTRVLSLAKTVGERITLAVANLRLRENLRNQSIRDSLTGLFNRRYLEETLEREIHRAAREKAPLSIIFIDIDHFKSFNDQYGHEAGDAVLRQIGTFLASQVRYEDIACRYGGEEFVIVLPDAAIGIAAARAEGIRSGVKGMNVQVGGKMLPGITLSLGVSAIPEFEAAGEILLRAADNALYQAKAEGRDRVAVAKAGK
ncbi:MAG: diguanylate cyclase [Anaerolineales bacterium]|nr:diguanylate cyclase [Anaerolineales bacterium]